ncbi:uncharacterized protein JN550_011590 [Neoarthrinium moseri]|uniref:uncharacterized protein n=1 Tax=Neoarthrinium moseri TaxID=1658444 RepID=UPI001FDDAD7A|nr:uncharacterized protein JN550_011590 [Neoarthrinium moseri]KAI1860324.1 hypothetical protein JN550_011590 [Neoarthrinium moseri]
MDFAIANRISYEYDLRGPSVMYKTACSSSGIGLHQALEAIWQGGISSAIVVGTNLIMGPGQTITGSSMMTLSPEGSSKSLDASADGYARGEAVNALYIKRLDEAIRDGNPIRAVFRSSASNSDGRSLGGITSPNLDAHEAAIRAAYSSVRLNFADTAMVEAHGTGTPVGDPIEVEAIARCFGGAGVYLGAVKPNLGHSEGAAAITSIMKAVLSLEHRTIIPNIKFNHPNPSIPWENNRLVVPTEELPWPEGRCERFSVNTYGIGGSNAHFILDSAASFNLEIPKTIPPSLQPKRTPTLLLFSAGLPQSLKSVVERHKRYLVEYPEKLDDLAYTIGERRDHLKYRAFSVTDGTETLAEPAVFTFQDSRQAAFVFTGQGAQWANMGRNLMIDYPSFMRDIQSMELVLQGLDHDAPSWSLQAIQIAVVDLLASWGVSPSAVVGHSSGEIVAAYAAGALSKYEALIIAYYRGLVCKIATVPGAMAALGLGRSEVVPYLVPGVGIACENSASSITLSGDSESLEQVLSTIKRNNEGAFVRKLRVEMAYHSGHMSKLGNKYRELISRHVSLKSPIIPFYSSVYNGKRLLESSEFGPRYWQENLQSPVLFHTAVKSLLRESPHMVHVEVGPHHALRGPLRQIYQEMGTSVTYIPTLSRGEDDTRSLLSALGQLYTTGFPVKIPSDPSRNPRVLPDLPPYPWHYDRSYWSETRVMKNWRFRKHAPHDLLGSRTTESTELAPAWRNDIRVSDVPWLKDHCVGHDVVFPAAGYIAMAGEAAYQLGHTTSPRDYTVKDVELRQALVLQMKISKEIVTTLRPQRLTTSLDSDWYEFEIVSYDGSAWNKHCWGFVRRGHATHPPSHVKKILQSLPRKVSTDRWYTTLGRIGLNYGPRFTKLRNITAGVSERDAVVHVVDDPGDKSESFYCLHPSTIDATLQSWMVAAFQGMCSSLKTPLLPTFIKELYVGEGTGQTLHIKTTASIRGDGHSYGVGEEGETLFLLRGFQVTRLPSDENVPAPTALQLQWAPDFSFLDSSQLTRPTYDFREQTNLVERLCVLCALESSQQIQSVNATQPHFERYRGWLASQVLHFQSPGYPLVDTIKMVRMTTDERRSSIRETLELCKSVGIDAMAEAVWRAYDQMSNVFEGKTSFLDLLIHDGTKFFQLLGHTEPQMRILEIGAGTGGLTAKILKELRSSFGDRLYLQYTFTDVSSGFFVAAQDRFKEFDAIEYKVLDISKDPVGQGFKAGDYDLVIASNVLHATPILHETLCHVRTLLNDQGRLFLQELSPVTNCVGYIIGLFTGWWLGEADGRAEAPYLPAEEWDKKLRAAGFSGCDAVTFDNQRPYNINANIVSRPATDLKTQEHVKLLSGPSRIHLLARQVGNLLESSGCHVEHCQWGDREILDCEQTVVSFVDLELPLLNSPSKEDWYFFISAIKSLQKNTMLWITNAAQVNCKDPNAALILGMARTIRSELAMSLATLELEDWQLPGAAQAIVNVARKVQRSKDSIASHLDPDYEYAWVDGAVHVGRFHWYASGQSLPIIGGYEVQINVKAAGLNFKDVLGAMGVVHGEDIFGTESDWLGLEGAGYVSGTGADISHVKVRDRVMFFGANSAGLATQVQRPGLFTVRIPDELSFEDAASMPIVYVTVLLGLVERAQLQRGQSLLIHAAAGGTGIAAIHVARWIGAEIYYTVGSEEKANFLVDKLGMPRGRIFHSRDTSFHDGVMAATNGVGVDCVLNSVSSELLHTTWECGAPNGCMVELGKRDMRGRALIAFDKFESNRTFIGLDLPRYVATKKATGSHLMELVLELYVKGHIKPVHPITVFDTTEIEEAFRYMQQGTHVGKNVIRFPELEENLPWTQAIPKPTFRGDRTYLLVGGMGGLGRAIAVWMATYGAKYITFISRSAGKGEDNHSFIKELELMGCAVQTFCGDVSDRDLVNHIVATAIAPIAGVMHMAMALRDMGILDMALEVYQDVIQPRVYVGYYGQANYAASNTFLDAFVQYRHDRGLVASVIDIGPVDDVGYISRTPAAKETMLAMSGRLVSERDFLEVLQLTIAQSAKPPLVEKRLAGTSGIYFQNPSQVTQALGCRLPIMDPQNNIIWRRDPRMAIYRNIETVADESATTTSGMKQFLAAITENPIKLEQPEAAEFLACQVRDRVAALMRRDDEEPLDLRLTLSGVGVDSLVAIELRNWWKQNLGSDVSVLELMNGGSLQYLGEMAAKRLLDKLQK